MARTIKKKTELGKITVPKEEMSKVEKGNHLIVTTNPNGQVSLQWDWDALLKEVVEATGIVIESKPKKKTKK